MTDGWYYAHEGERRGPFSGRQLLALATSGAILRTDTVYREGFVEGVLAATVKHLFAIPVDLPSAAVPEPAPRQPIPTPPHRVRRLSAVAVQGAVVMSQDGERVKFKKKCAKCKHEDSSWTTLPITVGTMKTAFFCPKCRQRREVELRGRQD